MAKFSALGSVGVQVVMDKFGDSRFEFDPKDAAAIEAAERRFKQLTGLGFTAAVRDEAGRPQRVRAFDPTAEETLFIPHLVGG